MCAAIVHAVGSNVNGTNDQGQTPIHLAIGSGSGCLSVFSDLMDRKPDLDVLDGKELSPLHTAVSLAGNQQFPHAEDMAILIIDSGRAGLNLRSGNRQTALVMAIKRPRPRVVMALVRAKADTNMPDEHGTAPLHLVLTVVQSGG